MRRAIGDRLIAMAGMELMERSQTYGSHMFDDFGTAPLIPFEPILL